MQIESFRVQMYKGILDSGWVTLEKLTVIVGKNESGKTSLLRALHKFNPAVAEPYNMDREWPRGHRKSRDPKFEVCTVRFKLDSGDKEALEKITDLDGWALNSIEAARSYDGTLTIRIDLDNFPERPHMDDIGRALAPIAAGPDGVGPDFRVAINEVVEKLEERALEGAHANLVADLPDIHARLQKALSPDGASQRNVEAAYLAQVQTHLVNAQNALGGTATLDQKAVAVITKRLPAFIYMDDYRTFTGTAHLDQVKARKDQNRLTEEDKTLLRIMELAGLPFEKEVQKATAADREQRQYDLSDAGATLTREIENRWRQRKYQVEFSADGHQFFTFVKDEKDGALIRLEERSKGFQWYFSFDLLFMYESKGSFKNCVILLDEPGLHLHPDAQRDLLDRMEAYARDNTLVYTTHLPFMVDLRHPDRIRVLNESARGQVMVSDDLTQAAPESKFTLQAALGMSGSQSFLLAQRNLVVEGVDDFWILTELSNILVRSGEPGLPEDVFITAAGGASEAAYVATFMIGQKLEVAVLLDSDVAGHAARDQLVKKWLTRYTPTSSAVMSLGPAAGERQENFAIEDMFTEEYYVGKVLEVYGRELELKTGGRTLRLPAGGPLSKRVERALGDHGIRYNKGSVAKRLRHHLAQVKNSKELDEATVKRAQRVFAAIREVLP